MPVAFVAFVAAMCGVVISTFRIYGGDAAALVACATIAALAWDWMSPGGDA